MSQRIYVGNLSFNTTDQGLRELFAEHGEVTSADIVMDRDRNRPRGFGFVEMASGGPEAIASLNGKDFEGRTLNVNEARPRAQRTSDW